MAASILVQSPYLLENGPVYPVIITPSFVAIEALKLEKRDVPFIKAQALFDTEAQTTSVSHKIIESLKLVPRGSANVYTSQSSKIVNKYDIALEFDSNMYLNTPRVFSADLQDHSIDCLIGRDVLQFGVFTYDGPRKSF
jgi:hypothetical protein